MRNALVGVGMLILLAGFAGPLAQGQTGDWVWMGGSSTLPANCATNATSSTCGPPGVFGTVGNPAPTNVPGGRERGATWKDSLGNFWLFGGYGIDSLGGIGDLNDLWQFNVAKQQWIWEGGSNTLPQCSIAGSCGSAGVYGTQGTFAAGNVPGGRYSATTWVDSNGNFWLHGGQGFDASGTLVWLNDLWEFNPGLNEWRWAGGSSSNANDCQAWVTESGPAVTICGQAGSYGVQGQPGGTPGGRFLSVGWADRNGNLWLFGGGGIDSAGNICALSDLWEYSPSTAQWTWQGGPNTVKTKYSFTPGVYGLPGVPQAGINPGGRFSALAWTDNQGNFWLFGGYQYIDDPNQQHINDLWEFNPVSKEWAWMAGSQIADFGSPGPDSSTGDYGTLGIPAIENVPGGHDESTNWIDGQGNFWLRGGFGQDSKPTGSGGLNDLWEFSPSSNEWVWMGGGNVAFTAPESAAPGVYGSMGVPSSSNLPGMRFFAHGWTDSSGNLWYFGGLGMDSAGNYGYLNDLWEYAPPPAPTPTPGFGVYTPPQTAATVEIGNSITFTVSTYTAGGFDSPIALSASNMPAFSTAVFNPPSLNGAGTSQLTISTSLSTIAYQSQPIIQATSGGVTKSTSVELLITALPPDFSLYLAPSSLVMAYGGTGTISIAVNPANGFSSEVNFTCSGVPAGASCGFNPATVTPLNGAPAQTTLTITAPPQSGAKLDGKKLGLPFLLAAIPMFWLGLKRRRNIVLWLALLATLASAGFVTACGGGTGGGSGGGGGSQNPISASVTVTATSGTLTHTTTIPLQIN
jgi:hypothetical protein